MKGLKIERIRSLEQLLRWRAEVLKAVFGETASADLLKANARYYDYHNADGSHIALEALVPGADGGKPEAIGCGGVCFYEELPSPDNPTGRCAYIMNLYVRECMRHSGVGGDLLKALVDLAKFRGCGRIMLETTPMARAFYKNLGFIDAGDYLIYKGE
ncbi:MAG: GNAT family N-acetyltransferase [Muribaculaceae bacterium]|nr:GNAT family N-acetyltransferase [Muribaculaceae bacterium]